MKCCMESQVGDWMGQVVTFAGEYMGTVVEDRVRPVCWHPESRRVLTLDNSDQLRGPD